MLFKPNNKSIKFRLTNLDDEELTEIRDLVEKNGGVISNESRIIFTNNKTCIGTKDVFDVNFIRECVRVGKILELLDFKIAHEVVYSCWTKILIDEEKHCSNTITYPNCHQPQICRNCKRLIMDNEHDEHNYVHRVNDAQTLTPEKLKKNNDFYTLDKAAVSPSKEISDSQFSGLMYHPDDTDNLSYTQSELSDTDLGLGDSNEELQADEQNKMLENLPSEISPNCKNDQQKSPYNINAIFPLSAAEEEAEGEFHKDRNVTEYTSNSSNERFQETENVSSQHFSTLKCHEICLEESVAGPSRVIETASVPSDRSPEIEVIRELISDSSRDLAESLEWSTDSDETFYDPTPPSNRQPRKHSAEKMERLKHRTSAANSKIDCEKNCPPSQEQPGPSENKLVMLDSDNDSISRKSVVSVSSESDTVIVRRKMGRRTDTESTRDDKNKEVTSTKSIDGTSSSDDKNKEVTSTKSIIDTSSSDDDSASRNRRPAPASNQNQNRRIQPSRNFSYWEQREMIKYLIDTDSIYQAKGNRVWKQMIYDGYLKHRTYQSLHNHFRRSILPNLRRFNMDPKSRRLFEKLKPGTFH